MKGKGTILEALTTLPRDSVIVTTSGAVAAETEPLGRRTLLMGRDWSGYLDLRDRWSELSRRAVSAMVIGGNGADEISESVTRFCQITHMNKENSAKRSRRWAEHMLRNLLLLAEKPHGMKKGAFQGEPAFIVGAGPSLDKNRELLQHGGGVVVRINAASKAATGHSTLCVESNDLTAKLSEDGVQFMALTSPPHVLRCRYERLRPIWCGEIAWIAEQITGIPRLAMSGSGSTAACSLARRWGCDPIVLVGHDLAFTDGKVYASSTGHRDSIEEDGRYVWGTTSARMPRPNNPLPEAEELQDQPAWGGDGTVKVGAVHYGVRQWLTVFAAHPGHPRCINATEGGARIDGWEEMRLRDLYGQSRLSTGEVLERCAGELIPRDEIVDWMLNDAPEAMAEAWAYPELYRRIIAHQEHPPHTVPYLEARAVRRALDDVEGIVKAAEREIRRVVLELCR